ncbi:CoA transferase [Sulfolobus acidocaldarius SUSAZ]|nr:CoA transferase [Sulfolobus acidocaldarius SUSAZ]
MSKLVSLDRAIKLVKEGDWITISGISFHRNPMGFIFALVNSDVRNLGFVDREPGLGLEILLKYNVVKKIRAAMATLEWLGIPSNFRKKVESGEVEFLEDSCGAFIAGIRAGAFGIPFMPVKGVLGSDLVKLHEKAGSWRVAKDPFSGQEILLVKAITPDVAIIHVHKADEEGNAEIMGPLFEDEFKAKASRTVIITAEEIVPRSYFYGKRPTINADYVTAVVELPRGAEPTSMFGVYDVDWGKVLELIQPI